VSEHRKLIKPGRRTEGRPRLTTIVPAGFSFELELLRRSGVIEQNSERPASAAAIVNGAKEQVA